jgi:hypothetical protein
MPYDIGHPIIQPSHCGKAGGRGLEHVDHSLNLLHQLHRFYFHNGLVKVFDNSLMCFSGTFALCNHQNTSRKEISYLLTCVPATFLTTTYFLPVRIASVTSPNVPFFVDSKNASREPVTTPPASSAMTMPAQTSHGQQPISLT